MTAPEKLAMDEHASPPSSRVPQAPVALDSVSPRTDDIQRRLVASPMSLNTVPFTKTSDADSSLSLASFTTDGTMSWQRRSTRQTSPHHVTNGSLVSHVAVWVLTITALGCPVISFAVIAFLVVRPRVSGGKQLLATDEHIVTSIPGGATLVAAVRNYDAVPGPVISFAVVVLNVV